MNTLLNPIGLAITAALGGGVMVFKAFYWDKRKANMAPKSPVQATSTVSQGTTSTPAAGAPARFTTLLKTSAPATPAPAVTQEEQSTDVAVANAGESEVEIISPGYTCPTPSTLQLEQVGKGKKIDGYLTMVVDEATVTWQYLKKPIGKVWQASANIPLHGGSYFFLICKKPDGKMLYWDPNNVPMIADDTPQYLSGAMQLSAIRALFGGKMSGLEQFSKLLPIIALGLAGLAVFSVIGGK